MPVFDKYNFFGQINIQIYIWHDKKITNKFLNEFALKKSTNIFANEYICPKYFNILEYQIICPRLFCTILPISFFVLFWTHIKPFWTNNNNFKPFLGNNENSNCICYHRYWTNEYPYIFIIINKSQMNIRIYSPWKKKIMNIQTKEYICLNSFKYIPISKYLSHIKLCLQTFEFFPGSLPFSLNFPTFT